MSSNGNSRNLNMAEGSCFRACGRTLQVSTKHSSKDYTQLFGFSVFFKKQSGGVVSGYGVLSPMLLAVEWICASTLNLGLIWTHSLSPWQVTKFTLFIYASLENKQTKILQLLRMPAWALNSQPWLQQNNHLAWKQLLTDQQIEYSSFEFFGTFQHKQEKNALVSVGLSVCKYIFNNNNPDVWVVSIYQHRMKCAQMCRF